MNINEITYFFDNIAPASRSAEWDNDGVMLLSGNNNIKKILITLDVNTEAVSKAVECGAELIISHHPFIFRPIKRISDDTLSENIRKLIQNGISVLSYHTRMDASDVGINNYILESLGLTDITPFGLDDSDFTGRIGKFEKSITSTELYAKIKDFFGCTYFAASPVELSEIKSVAVVSGGGSEYAHAAQKSGADVFISGEFRHHHFIEHSENKFPVISIDHYHCENVFVKLVSKLISARFPELKIIENYGTQPFFDIIV